MLPRPTALLLAALALCSGVASRLHAGDEDGLPIVKTFEETGAQSKGTVLSFARTSDGTLFVGSNQLSSFDGNDWERIPLSHAYGVRALSVQAPDGLQAERVWIGSTGAIGYVERSRLGSWEFHSLQAELATTRVASIGDVWFVRATTQGAVFVASHHVLRWDGSTFRVWPLASVEHLTGFSGSNDRVWIFQPGVGLLRLDPDGAPVLAYPASALPPAAISWVGEVGGTRESPTLLVVTNEGVCRIGPRGCEELPDVSAMIRGNFPVTATMLDASTLAIATVEAGVVIANANTGEVQQSLNAVTGLATDNVHALWSDASGGLWAGLDNGFARVAAVNAASLYDRRFGLGQGTPEKVVEHAGRRYILTDRELFIVAGHGSSAAETGPLVPLVQRRPLLHDAISAHGRLWLAGFGAIWNVGPAGATQVVSVNSDIEHLCPLAGPSKSIAFTEGRNLRLLTHTGEKWVVRDLGQQIDDAPVSLVVDSNGDVWLSTELAGIYRFRPGASADEPWRRVTRYQEGYGLPRGIAHPALSVTGDRVVAFTDASILAFDDTQDRFVPIPAFDAFAGIAAATATGDAYWLVRNRTLGEGAPPAVLKVTARPDHGFTWEPLRTPGLETLGQIDRFDVTDSGGRPVLWFTTAHGILRLDVANAGPVPSPPPVLLRRILLGDHPVALGSERNTFGPAVPHVDFRYGAKETTFDEPTFYQTRLAGVEAVWSAPEGKPVREFTGLAHGMYTFEARAVDSFGRAGPPTRFAFRVIPPWYLRGAAIAAYVGLGSVLVFGFVRLRLRRLQRQTERLNRLVADRTRHLELVSTAKSEFLENISHEIRNPLNGIVGLSHMFNEERLSEQDRELARSLKASAEHLRRVSEEVLSFSALEYGQLSVEEKTFTLAALIEGVSDLYRMAAKQRGNTVTVTLAPEARRPVSGDGNKIETIVGNFVSNAIKYAPGTPIEIRAECETTPAGLQAIISVTDHGAGIPAQEQELIFQKFVRGTNAKTAHVPGTGIGLAACRVLARALGGSVGVDSEPGEGATFHLWIPLKWAAPEEPSRPLGGTALIVEDEEYNRVVLRGTAESLGYRTIAAGNAVDALAEADKQSFDLLLLDWELPGAMKGPDIARAVRARPGGERPVILAVTAHNSEDVRRRAREAGMDAFLLKPVDTAQVAAVITNVLSRRAGASDAAPDTGDAPASSIAATEETPLNLDVFRTFAQYAPEHAHDAAGHFVTALDAELKTIHEAAAAQDWTAVAGAAHRLRALAALVRASRLNQSAGRLQDLAKAGGPAEEITDVVHETTAACTELKTRIASAS